MNAQKFLSEFSHIVSAPNGTGQIRDLILQMAVSGRLVQHNSSEYMIEADLDIAKKLKKQYKADFKLKNTRSYSNPGKTEYPYILPEHWRWQRLDEITNYIQRGKGPKYADLGTTYVISQKCIRWDGVNMSSARYINDSYLDTYRPERFLQPGDLLWNSTGTGTAGRIAIYNEKIDIKSVADSHVTVIRLNNFLPRYIWCVISSPWVQSRVSRKHEESIVSGTTNQVELSTTSVRNLLIPCPPIEEQKRIVAKVDEMMALCDRLETQQQECEELSKLACTTSLNKLRNAMDSHALESSWNRVSQNISLLFDDEQKIAMLEDLLRTLAVRGLLFEWSTEHPKIDEIKNTCTALRKQYIQGKWIRRQKPILAVNHRPELYPAHWYIVPLDEVGVVIGGVTKGRNLKNKETQIYPYLRTANVQRGFFDLAEIKHIEIPIDEFPKYHLEEGDLLTTEGGDWDKVGRTAIWRNEISECLHQNHIFKTRIPSKNLIKEWVELVINSEVGREYFASASKQTTNLASINMTQFRSFPIPVPPLSEQIAILQKLDALLTICQRNRQLWAESNHIAQLFANTAVSSITGIRSEEKTTMKVPKTQLVSHLHIGVRPMNPEQTTLAAILIRNNGEMSAKMLWNASGLDIDAFYQQLRTEMNEGWIVQTETAYVQEEDAT